MRDIIKKYEAYISYFIAFVAIFICFFAIADHAEAYDNTGDSLEYGGNCNQDDDNYRFCGTQFTPQEDAYFTTMNIYVARGSSAPQHNIYAKIYVATTYSDYADLGTLLATSEAYDGSLAQGTSSIVSFNFPTGVTLNSGTAYNIILEFDGYELGSNKYYTTAYGSNVVSYNQGILSRSTDEIRPYSSADWLFGFSTTTDPSVFATHISQVNEPNEQYNVVTASTSVNFDVDYVSSTPAPSSICFELNNLTTSQSLDSLCSSVIQSGYLNFSTSTVLVDSNQYSWRAVLRDSNYSILDSTEWGYFNVVTPPYSVYEPSTSGYQAGDFGGVIPTAEASTSTISDLTLQCDPNEGFFEKSWCNLALLLFSPDTSKINELQANLDKLKSKQPFSAFYEFKTGWNNATRNPTVAYSTLTMTFYGEDVEIISTSTLALVAGQNSLDTIRYLMAVGLWIGFAWFCFIRVSRFF